ncbi:MAG: N-formylglutamate deformylase, partial [Azospirillum sp.]|nr:N-formylglutamate deformylase [Azospirillum sp.]
MSQIFDFMPGEGPVLVSVPHAGMRIPEAIAKRMTEHALTLPDTDFFVDKLYAAAPVLGCGLIVAEQSRYVVDLNRDPSGTPLYPGADNTELCPLSTFGKAPVYRPGQEPDADEIAARVERDWRPYHDAIDAELARLHAKFGVAVLWDGHSIPSQVPRFFDGRLPDLNLGSASGASADPELTETARAALDGPGMTLVVNGRFKGGYITRRYGRPAEGYHALQLEKAQIAYMDEAPPYLWSASRAAPMIARVERTLRALVAWARTRAR